jgi:hypothetical protein
MDKHLRYLGQSVLYKVLNQMGNAVSFADREFSANDDVQVNVEAEAHFPHEAFVEPEDAWYACGNLPDPGCNVRVRCNVGELQDSRPQLVPCVVQNNDCCTKCSPAVGRFPPWPSYQSYGDAKKCKRRSYRVTAVMPCVALYRKTSDRVANCSDISKPGSSARG